MDLAREFGDRLLRVNCAARRMRCSDRTLRRWIVNGLVPATRLGRRAWGIRPGDLDAVRRKLEAF